ISIRALVLCSLISQRATCLMSTRREGRRESSRADGCRVHRKGSTGDRGVTTGVSAANKTRGRGQLVQVALSDANAFAIDQKSQVTSCYFQNCRTGLSEAVRASLPGMKKFANTIGDMGKSLTAALWAHGPAGPASAKTASSDTVVPARDEQ